MADRLVFNLLGAAQDHTHALSNSEDNTGFVVIFVGSELYNA
jgi:hypothetical protein